MRAEEAVGEVEEVEGGEDSFFLFDWAVGQVEWQGGYKGEEVGVEEVEVEQMWAVGEVVKMGVVVAAESRGDQESPPS